VEKGGERDEMTGRGCGVTQAHHICKRIQTKRKDASRADGKSRTIKARGRIKKREKKDRYGLLGGELR